MYKALIVDDEKIVRVALNSIIDWEAEGFTVCGSVGNGESGLKALEELQPDLIIVDIKMPRMDGLTFTAKARELGFTGEIVILSNHKKFSYAVDAIRNSVLDYICKTDISPDSLRAIVRKARKKLEQTQTLRAPSSDASSPGDLEALEEAVHNPDTPNTPLSKGYLLLCIQVIRGQNTQQDKTPQSTLKNIVLEIDRHVIRSAIQYTKNTAICLIPQEISAQFLTKKEDLCAKATQLISLYMNAKAFLVYSGFFQDSNGFRQQLSRCLAAFPLSLYCGFGRIIKEDRNLEYSARRLDTDLLAKDCHSALKSEVKSECQAFFRRVIDTIQERKLIPEIACTYLNRLYQFIVIDQFIWLDPYKEELCDLDRQLVGAATLSDYLDSFLCLIELLYTRRIHINPAGFKKEIVDIDTVVRENLQERINLSMIAHRVNMSENYTSRLFKSEMGLTLISYINLIKMEKARDLLFETDLNIKEIALFLGFEEPSYFNRTFSKFYGINPTEYRRLLVGILDGG